MDFVVKYAQAFINLFDLGGQTFVGWVTGIVPRVLMILVAMNAIIAIIGQEKVNNFAKFCAKSKFLAYCVLPFITTFVMCNPASMSMGKFLPDRMKVAYFDSTCFFCHTSNGFFNHINAGELFVYLGIAQGVMALGLDPTPLAIRYLLIGIPLNFMSGCLTHFTTGIVMKQQGIELSTELD
ncbi:MAG: PTS glucitol/sorbitol transporter subunit IIC [Candidatus Fimousia sp.]|uniref:PTS glucitol/sorbitol transporter subunit IIC n=1 Tax=Anaerostipes sp. 992a TaxID=1261637 RepID=UPI0009513DD8|nr:PTS glucitol/sorbitol transporter subunit IIC [Anaerostipes sp. 992a]MDD5968661.1 PTS glucitol/sorbitol transporter subunit IIC [Anaerostipes sp.]OLR63653.1 PTS glucitol/sorbitol transporter subunit IIC [Anaerostipes sp. 992a]